MQRLLIDALTHFDLTSKNVSNTIKKISNDIKSQTRRFFHPKTFNFSTTFPKVPKILRYQLFLELRASEGVAATAPRGRTPQKLGEVPFLIALKIETKVIDLSLILIYLKIS